MLNSICPPCKRILLLFALIAGIGSTGCSSVNGPASDNDPLEPVNRKIYAFNKSIDTHVLRPVAEGYQEHVPDPVQSGVSNFFSNLGDVLNFANDLLQFKFEEAVTDLTRFVFNSTIGILGIFDVATHMGLEKNTEDFGQTLGTWGVGDGPYIVLPFLNSSTLRDTAALAPDWEIYPVYQLEETGERWSAVLVEVVDTRADLLKASNIVEQASFDEYSFVRDAYLQLRENRTYDGNPPRKFAPPPSPSAQDLELELELEKELMQGQ